MLWKPTCGRSSLGGEMMISCATAAVLFLCSMSQAELTSREELRLSAPLLSKPCTAASQALTGLLQVCCPSYGLLEGMMPWEWVAQELDNTVAFYCIHPSCDICCRVGGGEGKQKKKLMPHNSNKWSKSYFSDYRRCIFFWHPLHQFTHRKLQIFSMVSAAS